MDLTDWATEIGSSGPVAIAGLGTRGRVITGVRTVRAPAGIEWFEPAEMTVCCGAGTPVADLAAVLADHDQTVAIPPMGTIGGALAVGHSGLRRLGRGALRDSLLQANYVSAAGEVIKAGGPTVKNVSGFDLCRLLVGSLGTLGFLGEVILRTRPRPETSRWFAGAVDPFEVLTSVYRAASILWDGTTTWVCLEGDDHDVAQQAALLGLPDAPGPPTVPPHRWSMSPSAVSGFTDEFVAEVGVGVVHRSVPQTDRMVDPTVRSLHQRIKHEFDPTGRLNPGLDPLAPLSSPLPSCETA